MILFKISNCLLYNVKIAEVIWNGHLLWDRGVIRHRMNRMLRSRLLSSIVSYFIIMSETHRTLHCRKHQTNLLRI